MGIQSSLVLAIPERIETVVISRGIASLSITSRNMETERMKMVMVRTWPVQSRGTRPLIPLFMTGWQPQPKLHFLILLTRILWEMFTCQRRQTWGRRIIKSLTMLEREYTQIVGVTMSTSTNVKRHK